MGPLAQTPTEPRGSKTQAEKGVEDQAGVILLDYDNDGRLDVFPPRGDDLSWPGASEPLFGTCIRIGGSNLTRAGCKVPTIAGVVPFGNDIGTLSE